MLLLRKAHLGEVQRYGVAEDPQWDVCKQEYCCAAVNAFPGEEVKGVVQATILSMICLSLIFSSGSPVHSCLAKERLPLMARREFSIVTPALSHDFRCSSKASRYIYSTAGRRQNLLYLVPYDDIEGSLILLDLLLAFQDQGLVFKNRLLIRDYYF